MESSNQDIPKETNVRQQLEDELEIRRLLERYMRFDDDWNLSRMVSVFERDAMYRVMGKEIVGTDAIRTFLAGNGMSDDLPNWRQPGMLMSPPWTTHILSNPIIEFEDDDTALVESDFTVVERDEAGHAVIPLAGRYRDKIVRQADGRWLIRERTGVSMRRRTKKFGT